MICKNNNNNSSSIKNNNSNTITVINSSNTTSINNNKKEDGEDQKTQSNKDDLSKDLQECNVNFIEELDVREHIIFTGDSHEVRGGHPDALLVHATRDNNDHLYQDIFLTTYRTFHSPLELIEKLIDRYFKFNNSTEVTKQRAARETFSLIVQVVSELTAYELETSLVKYVTEFVHQLLSSGHFSPAKTLRNQLLKRCSNKSRDVYKNELLSSLNVCTRQYTLLGFKSEHIAQQMTLLDSELFIKIEIPEVLAWIEQQNEEKSPNLTRFTEHFNKVSYWARTRILEQNEPKDREKYVMKFIKIMKHLRKMNNFNSYLSLLSALDSAPIRRLEWQKHITEGLEEYCALIDSTSSFRAYRQALAETHPPCIPYIGLVLQDLTFVHIGNPHLCPYAELPQHIQYKNVINFSKRRQQYNIVQNMKRFKDEVHNFDRQEEIIEFFNNFENFLCEEAMWQMSETIKPRGKPKH